jgi:hypothetical protein
MLKSLNKNDTQVTPFVVSQNWDISNVTNEAVVLMEHSGSDGPPVALEYLDFEPDAYPITASNCDIALEQQPADVATFRIGLNLLNNTTNTFFANQQPTNDDGTYQSVVYGQINTTFYNNYRDPSKIWGLENIDFELSQTKRFIADEFKLLDIPQLVFGEKITPNSVTLYDTTTDNDYVITDDGNCNLFAGPNIFASQQELGSYVNNFVSGSLSFCNLFDTISPPSVPLMQLQYNICEPPSVIISWDINQWLVEYYAVEKSLDGIHFTTIFTGSTLSYVDTNVTYSNTYWYQMYAVNLLGSSSMSPSQSITTTYFSWSLDPDTWSTAGDCGPAGWSTL